MSTDYYLDCKTCKEAVNFTDNKANPPVDSEMLKDFLIWHVSNKCHVVMESDNTIDYDNTKRFKEAFKGREQENERAEKRFSDGLDNLQWMGCY